MIEIPDKLKELPEAKRLLEADAEFHRTNAEMYRLANVSKRNLAALKQAAAANQLALQALQEAQAAFDAVAGLPNLAGVTERVRHETRKLFGQDHQEHICKLLDTECGRNLPSHHSASAEELEYIQICILRLSGGNLHTLNQHIKIAQQDTRDVLAHGQRLMTDYRRM